MLANLVSRLRDRLVVLERDHSREELAPLWSLLARAEYLLLRDVRDGRQFKQVVSKLRNLLEIG